ncbi:MAG: zf-HC2 domain-containing protein [Blastocatellia bacterium]|nr:zf-HC2 domain-containing protein [Blastocatellia bacterium]
MNDHLSDSQLILFQARALPSAEMIAALEHLAQCIRCRQHSHGYYQATNAYQASTIILSPAFQWRHEHLETEQIKAFVNKTLDQEDEEMAQAHLQTCPHCRAEVQDWRSFEKELQTELRTRYGLKPTPTQASPWKSMWPAWQWKPLFASLLVAVLLATIVVILNQANRKAPSPNVAAIPSPTTSASQPSPSVSPTMLPNPTGEAPEETVIASLRDRAGIIAVTQAGSVEGLPAVAEEFRGDIVAALRTGKLDKPSLLNDLASEAGTVRGKVSNEAISQLLAPIGITVLATRPVLQWQGVEKATGYEVQIADGRGNEIAHSGILAASTNRWQPPQSLPRGVLYAWSVRAIHEGSTTSAMLPTGRFKVLDTAKARELNRLKAQTNSHLALGMFYAREGMLPEAKQEMKSLAKKNPTSLVARKLLQTVQGWR